MTPKRPKGDRASVFVVRDGCLLVMHRRKKGAEYDSIPGGTVEGDEFPEEAAVREIEEETSLVVTVSRPVLIMQNQGRNETYYDALSAEGEPVLGGPEARRNSEKNFYALEWVPLGVLPQRKLMPPRLHAWLSRRLSWVETG